MLNDSPAILYPRLRLSVARELYFTCRDLNIAEALERSAAEHPKATYAPTGGHRATVRQLTDLQDRLREVAVDARYPGTPSDAARRAFDAGASELLHDAMRITPAEASKPWPWMFLTCVLVPDIVRWRFPGRLGTTEQERFLGTGGLANRNALARLWWRAEVLKVASADQPYELLQSLGEYELSQITERTSISGSPLLTQTVARVYLTHTGVTDVLSRVLLVDALKRIRRLLSFVAFESLDALQVQSVVESAFADSRESILSAADQAAASDGI